MRSIPKTARWPRRRAATALFAGAVLSTLAASPAAADKLFVRYGISLIGVPLGTATLSGVVDPATYRLEANAKLTGIASVVSNARGAATASGLFTQGRVASNGFATTSSNSQMTRTIRIALQAGAVKASEIVPPFESPPDRIPVLESQTRAVVDPLSGMMIPVAPGQQVAGPGACARPISVFDGWSRFDIGLDFAGTREMKIKGYRGPIAVCGVRYIPISGHRDRPVIKFMAENRDMQTWIAPVGPYPVGVPLYMAVKTLIGMLTIEATEYTLVPGSAQALAPTTR